MEKTLVVFNLERRIQAAIDEMPELKNLSDKSRYEVVLEALDFVGARFQLKLDDLEEEIDE